MILLLGAEWLFARTLPAIFLLPKGHSYVVAIVILNALYSLSVLGISLCLTRIKKIHRAFPFAALFIGAAKLLLAWAIIAVG
jgi:hypothetical protein